MKKLVYTIPNYVKSIYQIFPNLTSVKQLALRLTMTLQLQKEISWSALANISQNAVSNFLSPHYSYRDQILIADALFYIDELCNVPLAQASSSEACS